MSEASASPVEPGVAPAWALPSLESGVVGALSTTRVSARRRPRAPNEVPPMLTKWLYDNRIALRVVSSTGGATALALVLAAPGKWK